MCLLGWEGYLQWTRRKFKFGGKKTQVGRDSLLSFYATSWKMGPCNSNASFRRGRNTALLRVWCDGLHVYLCVLARFRQENHHSFSQMRKCFAWFRSSHLTWKVLLEDKSSLFFRPLAWKSLASQATCGHVTSDWGFFMLNWRSILEQRGKQMQ